MRIKCPNCGSTTQVTLTWKDTDNYSTIESREYVCGCGCHFEVDFEAIKPNILGIEVKEND